MRRSTSAFRLASILLLLVAAPIPGADWPTFGHDPQRSDWALEEDTLKPENVGGLELKWKAQVKNQARSLPTLTAPVVASEAATPRGVQNCGLRGWQREQLLCPRRPRRQHHLR